MWIHKNTFAIGGLQNVGYAPNQDILMVLSSQGEGIFNCITGEKIARKHNDDNWWFDTYNPETNIVEGFDCLHNIKIQTHGLNGGDNLPKKTIDGWQLISANPEPGEKPFEQYMVTKLHLESPNKQEKIYLTKDGACEFRAFGFSSTGKSFIIASSCELHIYTLINY